MIEVATAGGDKEVNKPPGASIKELASKIQEQRGCHRSGVERAQDHIQDSALCLQEGGYAYSLARRTEGQGLRGRGTFTGLGQLVRCTVDLHMEMARRRRWTVALSHHEAVLAGEAHLGPLPPCGD